MLFSVILILYRCPFFRHRPVISGIELNSHFIEIDVHMTTDGQVVAFHDDKIDRTTNGSGKIKDKSLSELKLLDAGSWFDPRFSEEKIPTLEEILKLDFKNSDLIIEVKNVDNIYDGIEQKIVDLVKESNFDNKIIYKSFSTEVLDKFNELDPDKEILYVTIGPFLCFFVIDDWLRVGSVFDIEYADYIQVHRFFISESTIKKAHEKGKKIIVWDVHDPKDIKKMISKGVDIIETDYPERVIKED